MTLKKNIGRLPYRYLKVDTATNGDTETYVSEQRKKENNLFPLRIDRTTTILVPKERCTEEYAEVYRKKHGMGVKILSR